MNSPENIYFFTNWVWNSKQSKYQQLINYIKQGIAQQALTGWLPSSRKLAALLAVNRNTVVKALEELTWEGWLLAFPKKGLQVNKQMGAMQRARATQKKSTYKLRGVQLNNFENQGVHIDQSKYLRLQHKFLQQPNEDNSPDLQLKEWM